MKPFNLQEALAGKPVVRRDGEKVKRIIHIPETQENRRVLAVLSNGDTHFHFENGAYYRNSQNPGDLFMASEKKEGWVNVYPPGNVVPLFSASISQPYKTKELADERTMDGRIACVRIEWSE